MNDWFEAERHVERAHEFYEAGRWDEAESELLEALAINPNRPEWYFNLALTQEAAGKFDGAIDSLTRANELSPDDAQVLLLLGTTAVRAGRHEDAVKWLTRAEACAAEPIADSIVWRIDALTSLGRHDEAETAFYEVLQLPGQHAAAYANIAESLIERGQYDRAVYCLREAASIDPDLPRVHARLADAMARTGRHERARQLYLRELRDHPGDVDTLLDLGCLLVEMNRLSEAGEKFRRVLELESDNADAHFYLGDLSLRQHRLKEAEAAFQLVLRLEPRYPEARRRLAELHIRRGEVVAARRLLRKEFAEVRHDGLAFTDDDLGDLAELLLDVRLYRDAARALRLLTERRNGDSEAHHLLSLALLEQGDRPGGIAACRVAIRLNPRNIRAIHNMTLALMRDRQWDRARTFLNQGLELDPEDHGLKRLRVWMRLRSFVGLVERLIGRAGTAAPS
ncbi:MAG: tetratricopeptide repeat protein [Planctomycetota bacterium]